jgi:hypothetical protein
MFPVSYVTFQYDRDKERYTNKILDSSGSSRNRAMIESNLSMKTLEDSFAKVI